MRKRSSQPPRPLTPGHITALSDQFIFHPASRSIDEIEMAGEIMRDLLKQRDELLAALETHATKDVIAERRRQQIVEGWTTDHDDQHKNGEMPRAAGLYAISAGFASKYMDGETETCPVPDGWPWGPEWWKPANSRRDLVKAAALILAEIERIDRAAIASVKGGA